MYCAYVTRIHNLRKHTNADRLLCGECFGNTVIVDLGTDPDQLGVYFPTDGMLLSRPTPGLDITFRKCAAFRRRWQLWHLTGSLNVSLRIGFTTMARIGNLSVSMLTSILPYINGTMPTRKRCSLPCSTPAFSLSQKKRSVTV